MLPLAANQMVEAQKVKQLGYPVQSVGIKKESFLAAQQAFYTVRGDFITKQMGLICTLRNETHLSVCKKTLESGCV